MDPLTRTTLNVKVGTDRTGGLYKDKALLGKWVEVEHKKTYDFSKIFARNQAKLRTLVVHPEYGFFAFQDGPSMLARIPIQGEGYYFRRFLLCMKKWGRGFLKGCRKDYISLNFA